VGCFRKGGRLGADPESDNAGKLPEHLREKRLKYFSTPLIILYLLFQSRLRS